MRKSQAGAPSLWGPHFMFESERVILKPVTVVTFGLLRLEYGGSIRRDPRLRVNCLEVSVGSPLPMEPADHVICPSGSPEASTCRHFWAREGRILRKSRTGVSSLCESHGNLRREPGAHRVRRSHRPNKGHKPYGPHKSHRSYRAHWPHRLHRSSRWHKSHRSHRSHRSHSSHVPQAPQAPQVPRPRRSA